MVRIVHLSDFHFDNVHLYDFENFLLKALIEDLVKFNDEKQIDFILFTGDLVDKGGQSFDNDLEIALLTFEEKVIEPIINKLNIPKSRFIFCPGNHDIDRKADKNFEEEGLCSILTCTEEVNKFIEENSNNSGSGIKRISYFKNFEKLFHKDYPEKSIITNFFSNYQVTVESNLIGITCFNSCWRCYESHTDKERLILGERQVIEARKYLEKCQLKIAIMHHPIDCLVDFDNRAVRNFIHKDYDILFCGHSHEGSSWLNSNYYGGLFVSMSPSNWSCNLRNSDRHYANGYSLVDYNHKDHSIVLHHRRYSHNKECFDPNTDLGDETGKCQLNIPRQYELTTIDEENQIATFIEKMHFESVNEHLLSYNTDTKAPKKLDELFVNPNLVEKIDPDPEDEKCYDYSRLIDDDENIIIFGTKESGKTILLDKLIVDLTLSINKFRKIPVYFNFPEIKGKRYETVISRFLNVGIKDVKNFILNHKLIFLVDNLSFINGDHRELAKLEKFLGEHKNIKVIATSLQTIEGSIPLEFPDFSFFSEFKHLYLKGFKTKEIKALIKSWFSNNTRFETPAKLNKLIDFFTSLNLPRTPLAISMFLWIAEKQEHYRPVNHAVMLEHFIERLFKKLSKNEIYSDEPISKVSNLA